MLYPLLHVAKLNESVGQLGKGRCQIEMRVFAYRWGTPRVDMWQVSEQVVGLRRSNPLLFKEQKKAKRTMCEGSCEGCERNIHTLLSLQ
jgi:hypothetical protein